MTPNITRTTSHTVWKTPADYPGWECKPKTSESGGYTFNPVFSKKDRGQKQSWVLCKCKPNRKYNKIPEISMCWPEKWNVIFEPNVCWYRFLSGVYHWGRTVILVKIRFRTRNMVSHDCIPYYQIGIGRPSVVEGYVQRTSYIGGWWWFIFDVSWRLLFLKA